jgi:hypothetical protein
MATICEWFGLKTIQTVFAGLASKPVVTVSSGLASKPAAMVSSGLASKPAVTVFSGLASKPAATVFSSLVSKLVTTVSPGLASEPTVDFPFWASKPMWWRVSRFGPQNRQFRFSDLDLKISTTVSWFRPQNRRKEFGVGHASRSSSLLSVEASLIRVFQSGLKTGGGAMMSGACGTVAEVASKGS